ncbi:Hypothetical protein SMAX5B_003943 [Scophthalmus maximus]|uniref:Uncharacterized protein n=1 Tax=Scophthalmus maximus TaxID=52904 RepID=A0A2U9AVC9_SCOMX|nr:Hypothetical protein SMAX5B_003943 [Scophthalmus maximus]
MSGSCVRVDPPFVEFRDVSVGQVYRRTVTATNDGKTMKNIIFQTPNLKLLTAASAATEEMVRDCLLIHIDDVTVDIPLIGCIRVDPPFVEFSDVRVGDVYKTTVTATNDGKALKKIIFQKPNLKLFKFTAASAPEFVAPGLSVSGLLQFTPEQEEVVRDCLLIHTDDVTIEIPLIGFPRTCSLLTDSVLDFGCVAANSQIISKQHPITNQGSAPGVFQVKYSGDPSVRLSPSSGVIAGGATKWLKVELHTDRPRQIDEKALIKLQNRFAISLTVRAEVVDQRLEVSDLKGVSLSCLWFGPVYFGTSRVKKVVLRNNGPQACDWVCQFQDAAAGTEAGTDLHKSTHVTLLEGTGRCSLASQDFSQVLVFVPKQGRLGPYESTTVAIRFTPFRSSTTRMKRHESSGSRQDYCVFLLFDSVERRHGFTHCSGNSSVELAVTGSGLPVSLVASPSHRFDFPTCVTGQRVDLPFVLQNLCPQLPVYFHFRKLALFTTEPTKGTIAPGQCQDVVLTFMARQQGSFQVCQTLDVLGQVPQSSDGKDVSELELRSFHTLTLQMSAACHGITSAVTKPTGSLPHIRSGEPARCPTRARADVLGSNKTQRGRESSQNSKDEADGGASHRPYRTMFPSLSRERYVDTNSAFEEEEEQRRLDRQVYTDFIKQLRQTRLSRIKEREVRQQEKVLQEVDIGIIPAQGLVPPKFHLRDIERSEGSETKSRTKRSCSEDMTSISQKVKSQASAGMGADSSNSQQEADCSRTLTAQELCQVVIGPSLVDFGEVCVESVCVQTLELTNHLSLFVRVQLEVDCPELQGSSPLSHVLPPHSHNTLPLTFQSNKLGSFYRPVSYSVNQQHPGQILVQAQVVPLALELSTTLLVLRPTPTLLAQSGYRSSVTLRNHGNHTAEFAWRPVVTERGVLYSIRPATGTVEPYSELDCEVMWHPSFSSPEEGDFDLSVHEGDTQQLHCVAKVLDVSPLPGMTVSPCEGVVPSRGQAVLQIHFSPDSIISVAATSAEGRREAELCTVTPSSGSLGPGQSICLTVSIRPEAITTVSGRSIRLSLPLYLGDKDGEARAEEAEHQPYRELPVTVIVQIPSITIHPPQILLTPVPLENSAVATLTLLAVGYPSGTRISAEVDELKREDGTKMQPVAVTFPDGNCIPTQKQNQVQRQEANGTSLICRVSFSSAVPLSLCTTVTFTEQHFNNRFKVKLCAIADNCLLTVWPHMARHRSEQQIVLKTGNVHTNKHRCTKYGSTAVKAILQRYCTPSPASGPVSSSSSSFDHNNSTNKNSASDSFADSDSVSSQTSREEEVWSNRRTLANVGIPEFPTADSDEGRYHQSVLLAVERWFSLFGWPNGPHPISVPHTLRRIVTKTQVDPSGRRNFRVSQNLDHRSVVDMLHHLTGKQIPGIPRSGSFSTDIDKRTAELLQQHKAMLAFFRVQGACLWHIKPEYLLDMQEFKHWCSLQSKKEEAGPDFSSVDYESLSKRSWTDVLLQIYKVLVLCRVSENRPKTIPNREDGDGIRAVNLQPVTSNVYSAGEIQLLSWLNEHYQSMRKTVWGAGFVPSARWIVNFDLDLTDGLVLAALLAAYCPYLICSHFRRMYTAPSSLEQILHNNIVVVRSLTALSLNMDIQADRAGHFTCQVVLKSPCDTRVYMLEALVTSQGKLSLHNNYDGTEHVFTLRGIGERPLPVDHVVIHCPVGMTTHTQLDVPNYRQNKLTLKVVTDISVVSGSPTLEIKPGQKTPYTLAVSPRTQGKQTGCVSFVEVDKIQEEDKGRAFRRYEVFFSLEVICEPPAPVKVIDVQCAAQSSVAIEIPVINPRAELLMLDVDLSGDDLSGAGLVSVPPQDTFTYKATFSPGRVGKSSGSVVFRSELVGEICYRLELYALPPPVVMLPQACCPLGKPSSIGEGNHTAKITFSCPQLQEWCVFLSGRGLNPESQELLSLSSMIGSNASVAIPFKNPTEFPASLSVTLTGIQISEGASFDVPVVFVPDSMELQHVWLCISLKPLGSSGNNSNFSPDKPRSEQDLPTICWIRPLRGIPVEVPVDNSPLGVVQCDAGCQLERKVDVLLRGSVPGNGEQEVSGVTAEDFLCEVRSNGKAERSGAEDCLSASIQAARRNPETGNVTLTLHLVYTPLRPCRHSVVLAVRSVSGRIWKFPIILVATEPQVDDVILTEATELDKTSAGGVPLTTILDSRAALDQRGDSSSRAACSPVNEPQQSVTSHDFRPPSLPR